MLDTYTDSMIPSESRRTDMLNQYKFCRHYIALGETILIYKGFTAKQVRHVSDAYRLTYVDGIMYLDSMSCKGMTIVRRPKRRQALDATSAV